MTSAALVTLCDGNSVFFVAAGGQIRMAADSPANEIGLLIAHPDFPNLLLLLDMRTR